MNEKEAKIRAILTEMQYLLMKRQSLYKRITKMDERYKELQQELEVIEKAGGLIGQAQ